ncbi:hypothetical protein ABK040_002074 [Willaertia magna]
MAKSFKEFIEEQQRRLKTTKEITSREEDGQLLSSLLLTSNNEKLVGSNNNNTTFCKIIQKKNVLPSHLKLLENDQDIQIISANQTVFKMKEKILVTYSKHIKEILNQNMKERKENCISLDISDHILQIILEFIQKEYEINGNLIFLSNSNATLKNNTKNEENDELYKNRIVFHFELKPEDCYEVLISANYLQIHSLENLCCQMISDYIFDVENIYALPNELLIKILKKLTPLTFAIYEKTEEFKKTEINPLEIWKSFYFTICKKYSFIQEEESDNKSKEGDNVNWKELYIEKEVIRMLDRAHSDSTLSEDLFDLLDIVGDNVKKIKLFLNTILKSQINIFKVISKLTKLENVIIEDDIEESINNKNKYKLLEELGNSLPKEYLKEFTYQLNPEGNIEMIGRYLLSKINHSLETINIIGMNGCTLAKPYFLGKFRNVSITQSTWDEQKFPLTLLLEGILENNAIQNLSISNCSTIYCDEIFCETIAKLTLLESINLSFTKLEIKDVNIWKYLFSLPNLKKLNVANCYLKKSDFELLTSTYNSLTVKPPLEWLDISSNMIASYSHIAALINSITTLKYLNLSQNEYPFLELCECLSENKNLEVIDISRITRKNPCQEFLQGLNYLSMKENNLKEVHGFVSDFNSSKFEAKLNEIVPNRKFKIAMNWVVFEPAN